MVAGPTEKVWSTEGANLKFKSPACDARTVTEPIPVIVRMLLFKVPGPERTVKLIGNPDDAEALRTNGAVPYVWLPGEVNVMVCVATGPLTTTSSACIV